MDIIDPLKVTRKPAIPTLGIRLVTPFAGMLKIRDTLLKELYKWLDQHAVTAYHSFFLRLHVIDMKGQMDLEVGVTLDRAHEGDARVRPGALPAGNYVTLTYREHDLRANALLQNWAADQGIAFDKTPSPAGDIWNCRYEAYVTDPRSEKRKKARQIQLNFLTLSR
jgi:hypothetical protein